MAIANVKLIAGLPLRNMAARIEITFDSGFLVVSEIGNEGFKKVAVSTFKIPLVNYLESVVTSEKEITKKRAVRSFVAELLFKPAGLMLDELSPIQKKASNIYVISYLSSSREIKTILFSTGFMMVSVTDIFNKELKNKMRSVQRSEAAQKIIDDTLALTESRETIL